MSPHDAEIMIRRAADVLRAHGAKEVYVFGSFADGSARTGSDLDIAVRGLAPERFFAAAGAATVDAGRMVDVIDLDSPTPFAEYLRESGALRRVA